MTTVICPFCGAEVRLHQFLQAANKPFCAKCGWNLDRAQSDLAGTAKTMRLFATAFLLGIALTTAVSIYNKELAGFVPIALILGVVTFAYAWNYWGTKRALESASLGIKTEPSSGKTPVPSLFLQRVQALSRPRRVTLQFTGYVAVLLFVFVLTVVGLLFFAVGTERTGSFEFRVWFALPLVAIAGILGGVLIFKFAKERKKLSLFREGEVAAARVVNQIVVQRGKQSYNEITYEFPSAGGSMIRKTERDHTKLIFEDMLIPVFYDPLSPDGCVALCATYFRLPDAEN
jgi:uncharacterized protein (DUF983 family)